MALREDALQRWVERVESQRAFSADVWTTDELREIAVDMGLGADEFDELLRDAAGHRQRGETLFGHARIEDAREAFQAAADLVPSDVEALHGLARCHYSIGMRDRDREALETARRYAHQVLLLAPGHDGAAQLLNAVDSARTAVAPARTPGRGRVMLVLVAFLMVTSMAIGIFVTLAPMGSSSTTVVGTWPASSTNAAHAVGDRQMLVDFDPGAAPNGLHLDVRESVLSVYDDSAWANVRGYLVNDTELEFFEVAGQARVEDGDGGAMGTRPVRFVESGGPTLRPGESVPFYALLEVGPNAARWSIGLETASSGAAPDKYDPEPVIVPRMETAQLAGASLQVRQRQLAYSANQFNERGGWLRAQLRFENTGTRDIETLRVRVDGLGTNGEVIESSDRYVVSTSEPRLAPGDAVTLGVSLSMPVQNHGVRVSITDLR